MDANKSANTPIQPIRFIDVMPDLAEKVIKGIRETAYLDSATIEYLTAQVPDLVIYGRCPCGSDFCASMNTDPDSTSDNAVLYDPVIVHMRYGRIVSIEVLDQPETRAALDKVFPLGEAGKTLQDMTEDERGAFYERHKDNDSVFSHTPVQLTSSRRPGIASVFSLRISGEELYRISEAARARGDSVSDFIRKAALAEAVTDEAELRAQAIWDARKKARELLQALRRL